MSSWFSPIFTKLHMIVGIKKNLMLAISEYLALLHTFMFKIRKGINWTKNPNVVYLLDIPMVVKDTNYTILKQRR